LENQLKDSRLRKKLDTIRGLASELVHDNKDFAWIFETQVEVLAPREQALEK